MISIEMLLVREFIKQWIAKHLPGLIDAQSFLERLEMKKQALYHKCWSSSLLGGLRGSQGKGIGFWECQSEVLGG